MHISQIIKKNIDVTLDNKKRKMVGINDLNKIDSSDISKVDKNPDLKTNMFELGFEIIDLKKIKNNGYNLVGNHYREAIKKEKFTLVKLSKICHIYNGSTPSRKEQKYWYNGDIPWFTLEDLENGENV